ncbi:beta strand repeat-containing protein, partial [Azospirillum griseum]
MAIIVGTLGSDTLIGGVEADSLDGLEGDDRLDGSFGADSLNGGLGNDTLIGGELGAPLGDTLVGGAGDDVYEIVNPLDQIVEAAGEGTDTVLTGLAAYTLGDNVETLTYTGSGSFTGVGNDLDNVIQGGTGNDTLSGGLGVDTLIGGAGNDLYRIDDVADLVVENAGEGVDEVRTSLSAFTLSPNVEVLTYTGAGDFNGVGGAGNDTLHGGGGADTLVGAAGNDSLDGGAGADVLDGGSGNDTLNGGLGADSMAGGTGNDTYYVDDVADVVTELSSEGSDTVRSALDYTLGDHVEALVLTGSALTGTGNGLNNNLTGTTADNLLTGLDGNDTLNGGAGADTLIGGTGNDTYVVDNVGDVLVELPGEGVDTVQSSITHTLLADFENLTLTGSAAITGTGNAVNNALTGNGAANLLTGLDGDDTLNGGAGADTLVGGVGDDLYVVDNAGDVVTEWTGEGVDTVNASVSWALGDHVEKLTLTGAASINGTGNALDNVLTGNGGANILDGGLGADTLVGGAGNDVYLVDNAGDVVTEAAGQGTDEVRTALAAYTLGANVETLTYTGTGPFSGGGNALDNRLAGADGDDSLSGFAGNDTLIGGIGADTLDGGTGTDTASYAAATSGVVVDLASGVGTAGDLLVSIENLTGSAHADTLSGDGTANLLDGGAGTDNLSGGAGNDTLIGGAGADTIDGGAGTDTASYATASAGVAVDLASGTGTAGDAAGDALTGIENVTGGAGNDTLSGDSGANRLDGGAGDDRLEGCGGNDTLIGGAGTDTAVFSGNVRDYAAALSGATWTIQALSGADGTDTLQGVEIAQFADATIRLDVNNAPLIPNDLSAATNEDATPLVVDLLQGAWDFEGSALSVTGLVQTGGPAATVSLSGGTLSLNPNPFNSLAAGQTAALTFAYAVSDGSASTARTLSVTVAGRNDAPVASGPVTAATDEDAAALVVNLLQGASDPDLIDVLSVTGFSQTGGRAVSVTRTGGTLTLDPAQFNDLAAGESATLTFGYGVTDGIATTAQTLSVTVQGRNDAPVAGADNFSTGLGSTVSILASALLANDVDPDGDSLTVSGVGNATHGTVTTDSSGRVLFTPTPGYSGAAGFDYVIGDGHGGSAGAHVTVSVSSTGAGSFTSLMVGTESRDVAANLVYEPLEQSYVASLTDGGYVKVWWTAEGNASDIYARRYNADGSAAGAAFLVNTNTSLNQGGATVTALSDGGYVIGWYSTNGAISGNTSAGSIWQQRFDAANTRIGGEQQVNSAASPSSERSWPTSVTLSGGGWVTVWQSYNQASGSSYWDIYGQRFDASGNKVGSEFL